MPTISLTLPVSGTVITAGLHSTNYTTIQNAINGGLDNNNWAAGKIFAPSKFMQEGATSGNGLFWNGSAWTPNDMPRVYDRTTSTVDVANSSSLTTLYTKSITGNDMGTNKMLRLTLLGDFLYNNSAANTFTLNVKFGGTTFFSVTNGLLNAISALRLPWIIDVEVANLGASNSQMITAGFRTSAAASGGTGIGITHGGAAPAYANAGVGGISTLGTIDTTAAQTLLVDCQWGTASTNNSFRQRYGVLELV